MHDFIEKVLVTHEEIVSRCKAMGKQITEEYQGKKLAKSLITHTLKPFL